MREVLVVARSSGIDGALLCALFLAGRVRRPRDQGCRLDADFSVNDALTPLANMGQVLFDPPDVAGWDAGSRLVLDRRHAGPHELRVDAGGQPEVRACAMSAADHASDPRDAPALHARSVQDGPLRQRRHGPSPRLPALDGARTGSRRRSCQSKVAGLVHLVAGSVGVSVRMRESPDGNSSRTARRRSR